MSTLSIKLKQRARVLAAGAAITAITLAMLPGVAEAAKKDSVGGVDVGSTVDGSVGSAAPANSGSSEPITSATDATSVNGVGEDGANSDTVLTSDNTAPVPASVEATGDVAVDSPAGSQNVEVCGDLNADACPQEAPAGESGADGGNTADGGSEPITTATDLAGNQDVSEDGANGDTALVSDNTAPVPASGVVTADGEANTPVADQTGTLCIDVNAPNCVQQPAGADGPADGGSEPITTATDLTAVQELGEDGANGDTALNSDNTAPVPASGVVTSDVAVDSPAGNQNVEVCGDLNADACPQETATGTAPNSGNPITSVTDLTGDQELGEDGLVGDTALNSENTAPVPASGIVTGNGNVTVPGVANEDLNLCATLNQNACAEEAAAPGNNAGGTSPANGIDVDSTTGIIQELANGGLNGDTSNNTVINAPVPVNGAVVVGGNATVDEIANQNVGICLLLNQAGCGAATTPPAGGGNAGGGSGTPPNNGSPITSVTDIVGNQNVGPGGSTGTTLIDSVTTAPAVPASVLVTANGNAAVDGILNQGIDACLAVNANCGQATVPGTNPGGGTNPGDGTTPIGTTPIGTTPGDNAGGGNTGGDNAGSVNNGSVNNGGSSIVGTTSGGNADGTTLGSTTSDGSAGSTTLGSTALGGAASSSALVLAQQSSAGESSAADGGSQASASGGSQASASGGSQASASSGVAQEKASTSLPSTGGVSPLLMITMLLLIGSGIFFLVAMMRRSGRLNS